MKLFKFIKSVFRSSKELNKAQGDCKVLSEPGNEIFKISTTTPYTTDEIVEFMSLTGLKIDETKKLMANFCYCGISNLRDVITLVKMGYFHYWR